jgi:hypothetical protein
MTSIPQQHINENKLFSVPSTSNNQYFILWFDYKYDHPINIHQYMYSSLYTHICNKANINFTCTSFVNWG